MRASRRATLSSDARRMSIGVVASDSPAMAPRARALQPGLRSPARNGSTASPCSVSAWAISARSIASGSPRSSVPAHHAYTSPPSDKDPPATERRASSR